MQSAHSSTPIDPCSPFACCLTLQYAVWRSGAVFLSLQPLLTHVATLAALRLFWCYFCRGGFGAHGSGGGAAVSRGPLLREESVLFIPGIGLQLESGLARSSSGSSSSDLSGCGVGEAPECVQRDARQFLDLSCVRSVLINEGVQGGLFCFYLLLLLDGDDSAAPAGGRSASADPSAQRRIVLPFQELRPRLPVLKQIYTGLNDLLNGGPGACPSS